MKTILGCELVKPARCDYQYVIANGAVACVNAEKFKECPYRIQYHITKVNEPKSPAVRRVADKRECGGVCVHYGQPGCLHKHPSVCKNFTPGPLDFLIDGVYKRYEPCTGTRPGQCYGFESGNCNGFKCIVEGAE